METLTFSPQVQAALDFSHHLAETTPPAGNQLQTMRNFYRSMRVMSGEPTSLYKIEDRSINTADGEIAIRIYRPSAEPGLPVTLYFHGGWFFMGDLESHDILLRDLAVKAASVVIAVDYRLAPEHPFPAAIHDSNVALQWVAENAVELGLDASRMAVAGDSAGGALATTVARNAAHNKGPKLLLQALIYPVTDSSLATASWEEFANGPVIEKNNAAQAWAMYVPNPDDRKNPDAAPFYADNFTGMAPALILAAECDPLRDEVIAYAQKLKHAGIQVKDSLYIGMPHGFFQLGGYIDDANKAINEVAAALKAAFTK
ncbi:MAG TPA: alpha/beta hydrolase [Chitinophagaceae bacterium]